MKAARIHHFGPPEVIVIEDVPCPIPGSRELLVRVMAGGVGPWDALIREGKSKVSPPPHLRLARICQESSKQWARLSVSLRLAMKCTESPIRSSVGHMPSTHLPQRKWWLQNQII